MVDKHAWLCCAYERSNNINNSNNKCNFIQTSLVDGGIGSWWSLDLLITVIMKGIAWVSDYNRRLSFHRLITTIQQIPSQIHLYVDQKKVIVCLSDVEAAKAVSRRHTPSVYHSNLCISYLLIISELISNVWLVPQQGHQMLWSSRVEYKVSSEWVWPNDGHGLIGGLNRHANYYIYVFHLYRLLFFISEFHFILLKVWGEYEVVWYEGNMRYFNEQQVERKSCGHLLRNLLDSKINPRVYNTLTSLTYPW